ncbi:MAG: GGDEF domain-containing response regulator [Pseudomonadota bacterium]
MERRRTVLVVDDTVENLDILVELLGDYDVRDVLDARSALRVLEQDAVDLILLDIVMPEINGFELCRMLQADERYRDIPVIFITANTDEDSIEKAYDIGGKDYVTKPFKPKELLARVRMQLEFRAMIEQLEFFAFHDTMTGVLNRRKFFEVGARVFQDSGHTLFAMMVDIDKFKSINDTHGHAVGDQVIRRMAVVFTELKQPGSIFARLGGEEFVYLITAVDAEEALAHAEIIRRHVEALRMEVDGQLVTFTISCGLAQKTRDVASIDGLIKSADFALYQAKREGRNRTVLFSDSSRR